MSKRILASAALLLAFGCGGGPSVPAGYAGHWLGSFSNPGGASGQLDVSIQPSGQIAGQARWMTGVTVIQAGGVIGSMTGHGTVTMTIAFQPQSIKLTGNTGIDENGHLSGFLKTIPAPNPDAPTKIDLQMQ